HMGSVAPFRRYFQAIIGPCFLPASSKSEKLRREPVARVRVRSPREVCQVDERSLASARCTDRIRHKTEDAVRPRLACRARGALRGNRSRARPILGRTDRQEGPCLSCLPQGASRAPRGLRCARTRAAEYFVPRPRATSRKDSP